MKKQSHLVIFWTFCQRPGWEAKRYKRTRMATEYPPETDPEKAIAAIYEEHGRQDDLTKAGRPTLSHAIVASHRIIHDYDRAEIETWTATQEGLFDGVEWQKCLSEKP